MRRHLPVLLLAGLLLGAGPAAVSAVAAPQPALKIPGPLDGPLPLFTGAAATPQPLKGPWRPVNPALAADGRSGTGLAAGNGAASPLPGPLGIGTKRSSAFLGGSCTSLAFDKRDRLLALCSVPTGPVLRILDPAGLATIAALTLPARPSADRADQGGGTHLLVRADGTVLVPTNGGDLLHLAVDAGGFRKLGAVGLGTVLGRGERPFAVGAGYDGYDWVAGAQGTVITVPRGGGAPRALRLREPVAEDIATDPTGTYVVTRDALYRLLAAADGTPRIVWRHPLVTGVSDPQAGRVHTGPGTPPAMVAGGFVAVADGAQPPHVIVVRTGGRESRRLACSVPVFGAGAGSVEAPLVVAGRSLVVANAYGYNGLASTELGRTTTGGLARIVVGKHGCRTAWRSALISPSAAGVVSRANGLLYTVLKPRSAPDAWNLAALDWRTGALRFTALAGEGLGFNSDGGPVVLGPDGAAYAGSFGGLSRLKDSG
ncbi:hypothetical protein DSM112329_02087 [Paraconexibacter sp. AEG42_29]|uniref:FAD-binding PCMH-type domain-containing protein n=1 Tax=Paraconexibacter sp. AEG42_29 TaxID=2997339 RepID=A0AAU7AUE2_9ACTN